MPEHGPGWTSGWLARDTQPERDSAGVRESAEGLTQPERDSAGVREQAQRHTD